MEKMQCILDLTPIIGSDTVRNAMSRAMQTHEKILAGEPQYRGDLGWVNVNTWASEERVSYLQKLASEIREKAETFVLVGVGGSNQAARAAVEALCPKADIEILYAGNTLSAYEMENLLRRLDGKDFCINVIAKNFETLEPGITFRYLRGALHKRYGAKASEYIYTTVTPGSHFERLSKEAGYTTFIFPPDIGGRYSALSDVGLLPMAVAGIDIQRMVQGARDISTLLSANKPEANPSLAYAAARYLLYNEGYRLEMLSFFEPRLHYFARWWTQLFAESEGKQNKGLYPVAGEYSEDLHSIGQFVQQGTPALFETFVIVQEKDILLPIPMDTLEDNFSYLNDKDIWQVNHIAQEATYEAHNKRLPCMRIEIPGLTSYWIGQLYYMFFYACYISARMLEMNPFDQPGVEAYKQLMFEKLGKEC